MKKLSPKFKIPLMVSIVMPTMLMGLPAITLFKKGVLNYETWTNALTQTLPIALPMFFIVAITARLIVTKLLIMPNEG